MFDREFILEVIRPLPSRTRDIIRRRFALGQFSSPYTLEAIGQHYQITRERIRQIIDNALIRINQESHSQLDPAFKFLSSKLNQYGDLMAEEKLFNEVGQCHSVAFVLTLGDQFRFFPETKEYKRLWTINKSSLRQAQKIIRSLTRELNKLKQPVSDKDLLSILKKINDLPEPVLRSYLDICKKIDQNPFQEWGLIDWPEIKPRGVKDKAYLVLKREQKPLHFTEITHLINKNNFSERAALVQTVHNELIKDPRFILVGRGTYVLASVSASASASGSGLGHGRTRKNV